MTSFPRDVDELEDELSRPDPDLNLSNLDGPLLVLGAGGKMGPTLARMARRAFAPEVVAVARFSDESVRERLERHGVRTLRCDLRDRAAVKLLPDASAVLFLAGQKFGTSDRPASTWIQNAVLPSITAERFPGVPTVVFSSGNVYPFVPVDHPGANESTPVGPLGEYAWSVLARERIYEDACERLGTPIVLYRLNYASEPRYGVLVDLACAVREGRPIPLAMGYLNTIGQRDANVVALRSLALASRPPTVLNVTGSKTLSVREIASWFGRRFEREPIFEGEERETALLADAAQMVRRFGEPKTALEDMLDSIANWLLRGLSTHGKPTHFEVRDGSF